MAEPITMQKLTDASIDADTLGEFANDDKIVTSRNGREYPSAPMASRLVVENGLLGATPFSTASNMGASDLVDGDYAVVTDDSNLEKNGFWQKQSGVWKILKWNPIEQSKEYVNANPLFKPKRLEPTDNIDTLFTAGIYHVPIDSTAVALGLPTGQYGQIYVSGNTKADNSGYVFQTYIARNGSVYQRVFSGSFWLDWKGNNASLLVKKGEQTKSIVTYGSSTLAYLSDELQAFADDKQLDFYPYAVSGDTIAGTGMLSGANKVTIKVTGGELIKDTYVPVEYTTSFGKHGKNIDFELENGVTGKLDVFNSKFRANSNATVSTSTVFNANPLADRPADATYIINSGKNDVSATVDNTQYVIEKTDEIVKGLPFGAEFIVLGHFADTNSSDAETSYINTINEALKTKYGAHYLSINDILFDDATWLNLGLTKTAADRAAISSGNLPPSLARDNGHLSPAMDVVLADAITDRTSSFDNAVIAIASSQIRKTVDALDALTINAGKVYPFSKKTRDGITSIGFSNTLSFFVDCTVFNAQSDCYYAVRYYRNGATSLGKSPNGWIIARYPIDDYETASVETQIISTSDADMPELKREGVQTIFLQAPNSPELIKLTLDTAYLDTYGTPMLWNTSNKDTWSWIIDPSRYVKELDSALKAQVQTLESKVAADALSVSLSDNSLHFSYKSGAKFYRISFAPVGHNTLPNFYKVEVSENGDTWSTLNNSTTDWLPPLRAEVDTNGDAGYTLVTTGGNHGSERFGGELTAQNTYLSYEIDGVKRDSYSGNCNNIVITVVNEVMAANTIVSKRYAVRESFKIDIRQNGLMVVNCDRHALEPLTMSRDRGLQAVINGFDDSYLALNSAKDRSPIDSDTPVETKELLPVSPALIMQEAGNQMSIGIDASYGIGDARYVSDTQHLYIFLTGGATNKAYCAIINGLTLHLNAGEGYQWRGAYHIKSVTDKPDLADSQFDIVGQRLIAYSNTDYLIV